MPAPRSCPDGGAAVPRAGARCEPCGKARKRLTLGAWLDRHRPAPAPLAQADPDLPLLGEMEFVDDGARVRCHACGGAYVSLVLHIARKHGLDADRYRASYGLNRKQPLIAPALSARLSAAYKAAGTGEVGRRNLRPDTSGTKGVPFSLQASIRASSGHRRPPGDRAGDPA